MPHLTIMIIKQTMLSLPIYNHWSTLILPNGGYDISKIAGDTGIMLENGSFVIFNITVSLLETIMYGAM